MINRNGTARPERLPGVSALALAVAGAGLAGVGPAVAEEDGEQEAARMLERVMITGDPDRIQEIPGSAQSLDRKTLDRHSYTDPHRVLRAIPGVNVAEEEGFGQFPHISMRGTPPERNNRVTVMEDGVLVAPAPYAAPAGYYFPPMGRMDSVEVLKGSSSIKHGPYTTGGAINMISTPIPRATSGKADLLLGSNNGRRTHANVGGQEGQWGWLLETFNEQSDGFKRMDNVLRGPNQPEPNTGFDRRNIMGKLRWNADPTAELYQEVEFKYARDERTIHDTYLGLAEDDFDDDPFRRYVGSQEDEITTENELFQLRHYMQPTPNLDVTTTAYRTDTVRNWYKLHEVWDGESLDEAGDPDFVGITDILNDPDGFGDAFRWIRGGDTNTRGRNLRAEGLVTNDDGDAVIGDVRANNREYYAQGIDLQSGYLFEGFGWDHELETGVRYHQDEEDRLQWQDSFAMKNGRMVLVTGDEDDLSVPDDFERRDEPGDVTNRLTEAEAVAAFAQNTMRRGPWTVTPGLRFEYVDIERRDWDGPGRRSDNLTRDDRRIYSEFIPGLGATYRLDERWSLLGGVFRGFAPGGAGDDEEAERSVNVEFGTRYHDTYTRAEFTAFFNDYSNINIECTAVGGGCAEVDIGDNVAAGEVEIYGLEALVLHDLGAARGWDYQVPIRIGYTLTLSEFKQDIGDDAPNQWENAEKGDSIPEIPEHQINASIGVAQADWRVTVNANWVDSVDANADPDLDQEIDSRLLVDLSGEYRVHPNARLFAAVENVTDKEYLAHWRPAGARPGKPREYWAGVKVNF